MLCPDVNNVLVGHTYSTFEQVVDISFVLENGLFQKEATGQQLGCSPILNFRKKGYVCVGR